MSDILEQLKQACNGHPAAAIAWPHRVLHDAATEISTLRRRVEELEGAPAEILYRWRGPKGGWIYDARKPSTWNVETLEVRPVRRALSSGRDEG